ncbi:MAG: hypothetical protein ACYDC1_12855 [Limisphaerales bacterium]
MNPKNRTQLLAVLAGGTVALLVLDRMVVSPLVQGWSRRGDEIQRLKKSVGDGELLLDREASIRSRWARMETNTLSGEVSEAESQVFKAFDRWSQESRIGINSIKPQWKQGAEDHLTLECRVDAFGDLAAVSRFLYSVEEDPLALRVEAVELTTRDDRGAQLALGLQVNGLMLNRGSAR